MAPVGLSLRALPARCGRVSASAQQPSAQPRPAVVPSAPLLSRRPAGVNWQAQSQRNAVSTVAKAKVAESDDGNYQETEAMREAGVDLSKNYDYNLWARHRSNRRYLRHLRTLLEGRVLTHLRWPIFTMTAIAAAVCYVYTAMPTLPAAPLAPFTLTASVIGLLLVFRTNASYGRFHEARCLWGSIVNRTRDMGRQTSTWFPRHAGAEAGSLMALFQRWTVALVRCLKIHLRSRGDLEKELTGVLPAHELAALLASEHRPNYAMQVMGQAIASANLPTEKQTRLDRNMTAMEDAVGACERILRTPIPVSYTRHTTRLLVLWLALLPLGLYSTCGWATVPVTAIVTYMMLGIEEIGVSIEEPFSVLALDAICGTIDTNTLEILELHGLRSDDNLSAEELVRATSTPRNEDELAALEKAYAS